MTTEKPQSNHFKEDENGVIKDDYGNEWSPPIQKISRSMAKKQVFQVFGELILLNKDEVEWRTSTRNGRTTRVTGFYPGYTPAHRMNKQIPKLYVEIESDPINSHQVTWYTINGKFLFTADRDKQESAVQTLQHAIDEMISMGDMYMSKEEEIASSKIPQT